MNDSGTLAGRLTLVESHESFMDKHLIFIYGSLRRGNDRSMSARFPRAEFVGEASVHGRLYDLGPYPGLRLGNSDSLVLGEAYEVDVETLNLLDEFETSSNYRRSSVQILLNGEARSGWTYEPGAESYQLTDLITSGDWLEYSETKNRQAHEAPHQQ